MRFKIKKGKHRAGFWKWLMTRGIFRKDRMLRKVTFWPSCKYDLPGIEDDQDINKLFGFGFLPNHHIHSARVGWWYDASINKIVLMAYCYIDGSRVAEKICEVGVFKQYEIGIFNKPGCYDFIVKDAQWDTLGRMIIPHRHSRKTGYLLGPYFGGNNPAPHDIHFDIKKLKT